MALKNVSCPECGNAVSFTIDSGEEIVDYGTGGNGFGSTSGIQRCGGCDTKIYIVAK